MNAAFAQHHHVASNNVPFGAVQGAIQRLTTSAHERVEDIGRQFVKVRSIEEAHRHQLRELLGDAGYEELRALRQRPTDRPSGPGKRPASSADALDRRADQQRRVRELLTELKVSPDRLRAVNRESRLKVASAIPAPPTRDGQLVSLVRPYDIPREIREGKANPWTVVRPPFPGWSWYYTGWQNGFGFTPTLFLNAESGQVGNSNFLFDSDASDFDHAQIEYNSSVGFWYQMPANGRLDVWIEAQADETLHHLSVIDEWGVSDAFAWHENYLVVKADGLAQDPWQKSLTSWFKYDWDQEGVWNEDYIHHGTTSWAHLVTQNWFPKDSWVYLSVGTTSWQRTAANDMEVYSDMRFSWFVKSVWVELIV